jgi:hypothetical protein
MTGMRERCEFCQAVAVNGYPLLHADTCAFSARRCVVAYSLAQPTERVDYSRPVYLHDEAPASSAVGAVERAGGAPQTQVSQPAADATGSVVSKIEKLLAEVDAYAARGTQANEKARGLLYRALTLARDGSTPYARDTARELYDSALNVLHDVKAPAELALKTRFEQR